MPKTKTAAKRKAAPAKTSPTKKTAKQPASARVSKRDLAIEMISREGGASNQELQDALKNQPHSIRGLISQLRSKQGLKIALVDGRYKVGK